MGLLLIFLGFGLAVLGWVILLIHAFQERILWGLACLLIPVAYIPFSILHWDTAKTGAITLTLGVALIYVGAAVPALK
jgi:hypothetical protein